MSYLTMLGLLAGTCTTIAFLPQVIKTWKTKSAKDLSLGMFVFFCFGVGLWLVYGIIINDIPIFVSNAVTLVLSIMIVYFKLKYK